MPNPTDVEKRCAVNAMRGAEHALESAIGQLRILRDLVADHRWPCENAASLALDRALDLQHELGELHGDVANDAIDRHVDVPAEDDGIIRPLSGGTGKGGGG